jgi:hypothetical protein
LSSRGIKGILVKEVRSQKIEDRSRNGEPGKNSAWLLVLLIMILRVPVKEDKGISDLPITFHQLPTTFY